VQAQYPVKVQAIHSKGRTDRYYVFIPLPLAAAIELEAGEEIQWSLRDRDTLFVQRVNPTAKPGVGEKAKKKGKKQAKVTNSPRGRH
jgi:hypothetical protein